MPLSFFSVENCVYDGETVPILCVMRNVLNLFVVILKMVVVVG